MKPRTKNASATANAPVHIRAIIKSTQPVVQRKLLRAEREKRAVDREQQRLEKLKKEAKKKKEKEAKRQEARNQGVNDPGSRHRNRQQHRGAQHAPHQIIEEELAVRGLGRRRRKLGRRGFTDRNLQAEQRQPTDILQPIC